MSKCLTISTIWLIFFWADVGWAQAVVVTEVRPVHQLFATHEPFRFRPGDSTVQLTYRQNAAFVSVRSPLPDPLFSFRIRRLLADSIITRDTFLFLPNLPNGDMTLVVHDLRHPWLRPARLRLSVEAPLWLRWWFLPMLFLYGMVFVSACLYLLYRYRIRQFLRLQRIRDRIARDLHDDMGSYLSSISILSQTAATDPARTRQTLDRIGHTARQVMASMSDIVWSVNPAQDTMPQILDRMQQVADSLFEQSNTAVSFDIGLGVDAVVLSLERRRDFYLIYKEAMTNACRYAQASRVRVALVREGGWLTLTIQDDGRGFDPHNPTAGRPTEGRTAGGGNGLPNMHNRAALLGGVLAIESAPGQGCTVRLRLTA